jgi:hypothetical protein
MANTFELIASSTVGSGGAASIDFTSIPSTYTDLVLKASLRQDPSAASASSFLYINGSQSSYTAKWIEGNGASASSFSLTQNWSYANPYDNAATSTSNTFSNAEIYLPNYAGSTNKSWSNDNAMETNATTAYLTLGANLWSNTSAINRLTLSTSATSVTGGTNKFLQYSTAYLYGVKNA